LSQSVYILYANLDTNLSQKETFQLGSDSSWLTVSPTSGQTPTQFIVQADPSGLRPSSTPYEGFILVNDTGNQNQNAKLPVHFLVQGAPIGQQLNTDASSVGFSYGTADVNNGANGFLVTVPDANTQLTVSATANQTIQIYARFGSDVVLNGSAVTSDTMSSQGTTASITLGTTTQPVLHAGTWYIAIQTFSNELTTGYIDASLTHPACTYALSDKSTVIEAGAGIGSLTLNTQGGCDWSASSDSPWLRITDGVSGTGTGRVDYAYDANTGPARTGNILAGGLTFSVTQASGQISAPQIESFIATPSSISYGSSAKLSWSVVSAESVMIDQGIGVVSTSGTKIVTPGQTRTYKLIAKNISGINSSTTTVTVAGQPRSGERILSAAPNPCLVTSGHLGITKLSWSAPNGTRNVELHVKAPDGHLMGKGKQIGTAQTGQWVSDGMTFYLQDVTDGKPLTAANTLDTITVRVIPAKTIFFSASPLYIAPGQHSGTVVLTWNAPNVKRVQIWVNGKPMTGDLSPAGSVFSGNWVRQGMTFYLQDSSSGSGKGASHTITSTVVSSDPVP
jgi:hypothetical protein